MSRCGGPGRRPPRVTASRGGRHEACRCLALLGVSLAGAASGQEARPDPPVLRESSRDFPKDDQLEARVLTATVQPGATSPWHTHPAPVAVYVIEGTITLEFDGREPVTKKAGEALLEPANVKVRAANHGQ